MTERPPGAESSDPYIKLHAEHTDRNPEKLALIGEIALNKTKARLQAELDDMFHLDTSYALEHPEEAARLKTDFENETRGFNVGQRFAHSLTPKYFGKTNLVMLGSTDHSQPDESLRLFHENNDLLDWARDNLFNDETDALEASKSGKISQSIGNDTIDENISPDQYDDEDPGDKQDRLRSKRWMEYEYIGEPEDGPDGYRAIITRIRFFIDRQAMINGQLCNVVLLKETVITLPVTELMECMLFDARRVGIHSDYFPEGSSGPAGQIGEHAMIQVEKRMYTSLGKDTVQRIHTAIFSSVTPVESGE